MVIREVLDGIGHLFYPVICPGCGTDSLQKGRFLCPFCIDELPYTGFSAIPGNTIERIFRGRISIQSATSLLYFTKQSVIRNLLHQLKYEGNKEIGLYFGRRLGEEMGRSGRFDGLDLLIPLPLHLRRERQRGYNQSEVLCRGIGETLGVSVAEKVVIRRKATRTQTFRDRIGRWENVGEGFHLNNPDAFSGKHLLLVDDVITTGATLEACGSELLKISNAKLSIATLAFTIL
jgi:ComF family protein